MFIFQITRTIELNVNISNGNKFKNNWNTIKRK